MEVTVVSGTTDEEDIGLGAGVFDVTGTGAGAAALDVTGTRVDVSRVVVGSVTTTGDCEEDTGAEDAGTATTVVVETFAA